ncbi:hypothetical protein EOM09_01615 [bacterium]|nr:hypothetical protein [bacterium]
MKLTDIENKIIKEIEELNIKDDICKENLLQIYKPNDNKTKEYKSNLIKILSILEKYKILDFDIKKDQKGKRGINITNRKLPIFSKIVDYFIIKTQSIEDGFMYGLKKQKDIVKKAIYYKYKELKNSTLAMMIYNIINEDNFDKINTINCFRLLEEENIIDIQLVVYQKFLNLYYYDIAYIQILDLDSIYNTLEVKEKNKDIIVFKDNELFINEEFITKFHDRKLELIKFLYNSKDEEFYFKSLAENLNENPKDLRKFISDINKFFKNNTKYNQIIGKKRLKTGYRGNFYFFEIK